MFIVGFNTVQYKYRIKKHSSERSTKLWEYGSALCTCRKKIPYCECPTMYNVPRSSDLLFLHSELSILNWPITTCISPRRVVYDLGTVTYMYYSTTAIGRFKVLKSSLLAAQSEQTPKLFRSSQLYENFSTRASSARFVRKPDTARTVKRRVSSKRTVLHV